MSLAHSVSHPQLQPQAVLVPAKTQAKYLRILLLLAVAEVFCLCVFGSARLHLAYGWMNSLPSGALARGSCRPSNVASSGLGRTRLMRFL